MSPTFSPFRRSVLPGVSRGGSVAGQHNAQQGKPSLMVSLARALVVATAIGASATPSWADLTGTTVYGSAFIGNNRVNDLFSFETPCDGICGNGPIAIVGPGREYFWSQRDYPIAVDFSADTLAVSFAPFQTFPRDLNLGALSFEFKNSAFVGQSVSLLSFSNFPSAAQFTYALNADTLTVEVPTFFVTTPDRPYEITLRIGAAPIPEPTTKLAMAGGLLLLGYGARRRWGARRQIAAGRT